MNGKKKALDDLVFYVAHLIQERQEKGDDLRAIGRELGMSHSLASQICSTLKGIGADKQRALAKALTGGSLDRLEQAAAEWRRAHPAWLPAAYKERMGTVVGLTRNDWPWWPALAKKASTTPKHKHLAWAIWAAGNEPRGLEPREDRRTVDYVVDVAKGMLDLPEAQQETLHNEWLAAHADESGGVPRNTPSGIHGTMSRQK